MFEFFVLIAALIVCITMTICAIKIENAMSDMTHELRSVRSEICDELDTIEIDLANLEDHAGYWVRQDLNEPNDE